MRDIRDTRFGQEYCNEGRMRKQDVALLGRVGYVSVVKAAQENAINWQAQHIYVMYIVVGELR